MKEATVQYGANNKVVNFSVDGSKLDSAAHGSGDRRNATAATRSLSLHGENRNQIEQCVLCHNPRWTTLRYVL